MFSQNQASHTGTNSKLRFNYVDMLFKSDRWLPLIDLALIITAILMVLTKATVLFFHIIFVLLAFGAFFWKFRGFALRVLFWVTVTTSVVLFAVLNGSTQPDELIEIPLLISILIMVFLIASRRAKVQLELEQQDAILRETENTLKLTNVTLEQQVSELSINSRELAIQHEKIHGIATQLQALAQVTQTITAVRDLQELLPRITTVISENFGFYHIGIFLLDEVNAYAMLIATNSEGGKRMLERKHRLKVGEEGIVGNTASTGKARIALDVGKDAVFFNNPDLPDTHSEIGLPLITKNIIVGVLDVQSTKVAAFSNEDIQMLNLLADQVSLAIENARLFEDTRKALAESEMANRTSIRDAWARLPEQQQLLGYRYSISGATPLRELMSIGEPRAGKEKGTETESNQTVVPIELRGQVIGNLIVQSPSSNTWGNDQLDLIRAVAERVALSAENARLFEETTARAERERKVSDITGRIRQQNDPRIMIETAIEELRTALGASRVEVIPQTVKASQKGES